jgi:hypothetical protein
VRQDLPLSGVLSIFRFAILVEGIQSAARDHKTLVAASAAVDRDLARQFADQFPKRK